MSTTPTELLQTTAATLETTIAATEAAAETTAATESALDIESIKAIMDGFDPASLLPNLSEVFESLAPVCRFAVMVGPIVLLLLGLAYLFLSPREANYYFGYRCYYGMGSPNAWKMSQRLAGIVWAALGLVLLCVMAFLSGQFSADAMDQSVSLAIRCILWEIGLVAVSCVGIDVTMAILFDRNGRRRRKKK